MKCSTCGFANADRSRFCNQCGARIECEAGPQAALNQTVTDAEAGGSPSHRAANSWASLVDKARITWSALPRSYRILTAFGVLAIIGALTYGISRGEKPAPINSTSTSVTRPLASAGNAPTTGLQPQTPATHLAMAKYNLEGTISEQGLSLAAEHLEHIPKAAPEYREAQRLLGQIRSHKIKPSPIRPAEPETSKPLEYMLTDLDAIHTGIGRIVGVDDDIRVVRFRYLLGVLSQRTGESKYEIANATAQTTSYIRDTYGKEITNSELMEQTNKLLSTSVKSVWSGMKYRDAAMVVAKGLVQ